MINIITAVRNQKAVNEIYYENSHHNELQTFKFKRRALHISRKTREL